MSKARLFLTLAVVLVCTLAFAAPALAWTHGQFSATTDACAGCHVAHAAQAPNLLKAGPTQTQFCFLCHGDGSVSAPYDVKDGYTKATTSTGCYESTAGGFVNQFVDADNDNVIDAGESKTVTSRHNVWGFDTEFGDVDGSDPAGDTFIPGSTNTITGSSGFVCASCHDPHAGGKTPDGSNIISGNPRLLRTPLFGRTVNFVEFKVSTVGTFTYAVGGVGETVDSGVYRVTEYVYGSTDYCGACHDKFFAPSGSGDDQKYQGMYRHAFGVNLLDAVDQGNVAIDADPAVSGTPTETKNNPPNGQVACLSCHRAHSTVASMAGWANSYPRSEAGGRACTSALLRMNNRGVCYNCHGAAESNTPDL